MKYLKTYKQKVPFIYKSIKSNKILRNKFNQGGGMAKTVE